MYSIVKKLRKIEYNTIIQNVSSLRKQYAIAILTLEAHSKSPLCDHCFVRTLHCVYCYTARSFRLPRMRGLRVNLLNALETPPDEQAALYVTMTQISTRSEKTHDCFSVESVEVCSDTQI